MTDIPVKATPGWLDVFLEAGVIYPELCALIAEAVGFPVEIHDKTELVPFLGGPEGPAFQVMTFWSLKHPQVEEWWDGDLFGRRQFYPTPEQAGIAFVKSWRAWLKAKEKTP